MLKAQLHESDGRLAQEVANDAGGSAAERGAHAEDEDERGGEVDGELVFDGEDVVKVNGVDAPGHRARETLCED